MQPAASIPRRNRRQPGQASIFVALMLVFFLVGFVGFGADMTDLWFHRQRAQTAADAACGAGAMDMLALSQGIALPSMGFTPGTPFDCANASSAAPCVYAAANGQDGAGLQSGPSSDVAVSFPGSVPSVTTPPASLAPVPFMRVDVTDRVPTIFAGVFSGSRTADVRAMAECGLVLANSPEPIVVLHPNEAQSLQVQGNPDIAIEGGPNKSIEVNSTSPTAVVIGGSALIDLSKGGPNYTGSNLGVFGGPSTAPGGFLAGSTGGWQSPASPVADPFSMLAAPTLPASNGVVTNVAYGVNGCPDTTGCQEYTGGYYPSGIQVKNTTAIFDPGLYYLVGGLQLQANSNVRPSTAAGDGTYGTTFYFSGTGSVTVWSNSGTRAIDAFDTSRATCPAGPAPNPPLPATMQGNILMGPCGGVYGDPLQQYRGILFFQDRAAAANASWGGGGQFLLAGTMYFHQCNAAGTGANCVAPPAGYNTVFSLQGNSGSGTYVLGEIIADTLYLGGTSGITMQLNPSATYSVLKVSLLR